ncbi:MAG: hypothetical protein KKE23_01575 [Nanoarchaeota archaeon]|nr:hypothetical protein [Nanoarchaeota archaeon]
MKVEEVNVKDKSWKGYFPYEHRLNQDGIAEFLKKNFEQSKKVSIVEAPYGIGKSIAMLSAALATGKKVVFATCNNAAHHAIVDEVLKINQKFNTGLTVASVIGKEKLCLQQNFDYEGCEQMQAAGECKFYNNAHDKTEKKISHGASLLINEIESIMKSNPHLLLHTSLPKFVAEKCLSKGLCPYEITIELAKRANVVILDYFHVFTPIYFTTQKRMGIEPSKSILLVDEADELKDRVLSILTRQTSAMSIARLKEQASKLKVLNDEQSVFLDDFHKAFMKFFSGRNDGYFDVPKEGFIQFMELNLAMGFEEMREKLDKIVNLVSEQSEKMSRPDLFLDSLDSLNSKQFFYGLKMKQKESLAISNYELMDAVLFSKGENYILKDVFKDFYSVVLFSATIGDVDIFKKSLGIDAEFFSSEQFNTENFKVILKRDISSVYTQRKETAKKVANDIEFLRGLTKSVLLAFPSYAASMDILPLIPDARNIDTVKECEEGIYYVVLGGRGSRGINKAHNISIVYIYGLQIPQKDDYFFNRRRDFLMKKYSQEEAYKILYANVVSKACQVAGRIFRTRNKKGLVIFADSRYKYDFMQKDFFYRSFPKYFKNKMVETLNEHEFKMLSGTFWGKLF